MAKFEVSQQLIQKKQDVFMDEIATINPKEYNKLIEKLFITAYKNPNNTKKEKKQLLRAYELTQPMASLLQKLEEFKNIAIQ